MSIETATRTAIEKYTKNRREARELFADYPHIAATAIDAVTVTLREDLRQAVTEAEFEAVPTWDPEHPYGCPWCGGQFTDLELRSHHCPETATKINDPHAERAHDIGA